MVNFMPKYSYETVKAEDLRGYFFREVGFDFEISDDEGSASARGNIFGELVGMAYMSDGNIGVRLKGMDYRFVLERGAQVNVRTAVSGEVS